MSINDNSEVKTWQDYLMMYLISCGIGAQFLIIYVLWDLFGPILMTN